jgi:hypothetical protein
VDLKTLNRVGLPPSWNAAQPDSNDATAKQSAKTVIGAIRSQTQTAAARRLPAPSTYSPGLNKTDALAAGLAAVGCAIGFGYWFRHRWSKPAQIESIAVAVVAQTATPMSVFVGRDNGVAHKQPDATASSVGQSAAPYFAIKAKVEPQQVGAELSVQQS